MDMMSYLMGKNSGGGGKGATIEVVTELPETGEANVIYLVPKQDTGDNDVFDEYIYVNDDWELIGTTDIDLSNYYTKSEVDGKLPPIYVLNTTNQLNDGNGGQALESDARIRYNEIITDAYAKGYKNIAILLCSTSSGKAYMFYSNSIISTSTNPSFYADCTFKDKRDMGMIVRRNLSGSGTWNNGVFTLSGSLTYDVEKKNLLYSNNSTAYTPTGDYNPATKKYVDDNKGQTIQYETMPMASADYLGKIVQYTGTTNANYTNGYFYECVGTTENNVTTYSWSNVEVQSGGNSAIPIYYLQLNNTGSSLELVETLEAIDKVNIATIITDAYSKGFSNIEIYIRTSNNNSDHCIFTLTDTYSGDPVNIQLKPGKMNFTAGIFKSNYFERYILYLTLSWDGNIATVSAGTMSHSTLWYLTSNNTRVYTPTSNYNPATKKYVDDKLTTYSGYDATKTQILKNINGTLTWVDE